MTDDQLEARLRKYVRLERKVQNEILRLINMAEDRKLYLKRGYSSLYNYLTQHLKYSNSAAWRRIESARLLRAVPEASTKLETGDLSLSNLAKVQTAIRSQEKATGKKLNIKDKRKLVGAVENKSQSQADFELFKLLPETASPLMKDRRQNVGEDHVRLTITLTRAEYDRLQEHRDALSHAIPNASDSQVIARVLKDHSPKKKKTFTAAAAVETAKPPCCSYRDPKTGKVCGSTYQVERDHIVPRALGGCHDPSNRRPLCRKHNILMAEYWLGSAWANSWRKEASPRFDGPLPVDLRFRFGEL